MKNGSTTRRTLRISALAGLAVLLAGFAVPERLVVPVAGANGTDWNHGTFWYAPWGRSGVHKGIDIFADAGTPAVAASSGVVVFQGTLGRGGTVVVVLGPKWRFHYYAHMERSDVRLGQWLSPGEALGAVGTTGNAAGKPPHLHYSIFTAIPYPWQARSGTQGWLRVFFLNPHEKLLDG
ncbi:MAG: M23 family metallopeptidase [Rhodospirillales bacterium]|nr:M23 family metallopeptidase [Rhodospirillales bacterium]MDH3792333.1 M23 family metallopeptidase [Rhodospirillales bacterium]MDH3911160.1 M23 family metallopeptidase [Rhodospirillales bacterium]MDH3919192.1 M23 family metallopeptidase [Rhodospirillales bacterium]MDH3968305.1 M23 family metallopeptidase [Rhodospirillales bacterium]